MTDKPDKFTPSLEKLMTIEDLQKFTQIPKSTLMQYTACKEIPSLKIGRHRRYDPKEIKKWLAKLAG